MHAIDINGAIYEHRNATYARAQQRRVMNALPTRALAPMLEEVSSQGGFFRSDEDLRIGTRIWLDIGATEDRRGEISAGAAGRYYCHFDAPLSDAELRLAAAGVRVHVPGYTGVVNGELPVREYRLLPGWVRVALFIGLCALLWYGIARALFF